LRRRAAARLLLRFRARLRFARRLGVPRRGAHRGRAGVARVGAADRVAPSRRPSRRGRFRPPGCRRGERSVAFATPPYTSAASRWAFIVSKALPFPCAARVFARTTLGTGRSSSMTQSPSSSDPNAAPPSDLDTRAIEEERRNVVSSLRIKVAFMVFTAAILLALSGFIFSLVSRIFEELTPSIAADLEWKARRGATELAHTTELGILLADEAKIREQLGSYVADSDISAIVVT